MGSGGQVRKRARLPVFRTSHLSTPSTSRSPTPSANASLPSTSWVTTVKTRSGSSNLSFTDAHINHGSAPLTSTSTSQSTSLSNQDNTTVSVTDTASPANTTVSVTDTASPAIVAPRTTQVSNKRKRKRVYTAKSRLEQWIGLRDTTLDEILRHDGLPASEQSVCTNCNNGATDLFRCKNCGHGTTVLCKGCMLSSHAKLPLHRTEIWNGKFFEKASLASLGLCVQLGHDGRGSCPCPEQGPKDFIVFDTSGAHSVNVNYCGCQPELPTERYVQLLRMQWFPATTLRPKTAFTFDCLDLFHENTLQGKGNLYDYYHMLLRRTDNTDNGSIFRFPEIHRAFRLWRNLMAWKRSGRGQDPTGISGTPRGGNVVECPACPHPGRNLPVNWEKAGPLLYLYTLFIAVDANFKLKGKDRKLDDIDLSPSTGIFVDQPSYQEHISNYVEQPEINTCQSEHDAIVRASIRSTPGYAVSGVGLVLCSRHSLVRKNGVGDLQKGERYCNLDFIILSALFGVALACVFITYDIACQWSKYLQKRMLEFPEEMRIPSTTKIKTAIPSWHINGHGVNCRNNFCLGYTKGVGRTCGEEVEVTWSHTNPLAGSVREMALAARRDTLNDHWNGWNFRKIVGFQSAFHRKLKEAAVMQLKHQRALDQLTKTFKQSLIKSWTEAVEKWEDDCTQPNPYEEPDNTVTLQHIRLELIDEEAKENPPSASPGNKMSMTNFLVTGLDLESQQYKLRVELSNRKQTTMKVQADVQEKRAALQRQIQNWRQAQLIYTPYAAVLIAGRSIVDEDGTQKLDLSAENTPLFLPSALPANILTSPEMKRVANMENRLRKAAANDALVEIRRGRRNITKLWKHKKVNVSGTGNRPNTRMLTMYTRLNNKVDRAVEKYRRARTALLALEPQGSWSEEFKELRKEDIRGPGKDPDDTKTTNGRFEESWIWMVQRKGKNAKSEEEEFKEDMRVEWVKTRARLMRWKEEFLLVQEEMRRVIVWFEWKAGWWEEQSTRRTVGDPSIQAGVQAYAHKQASIVRRMAKHCAREWLPTLLVLGCEPEWASRYPLPKKGEKEALDDNEDDEVVGDDDDCELQGAAVEADVEDEEEAEDGFEYDD